MEITVKNTVYHVTEVDGKFEVTLEAGRTITARNITELRYKLATL